MLLFCNVTLWFSSSKVGGGGGKLVLKIGGTSGVSRILQTEAKGGGSGRKWTLKNSGWLAPEQLGSWPQNQVGDGRFRACHMPLIKPRMYFLHI